MLHKQNGLGRGEAELLEHRGDHHCAEAYRVSRDDHERKLPGECTTDESVIKPGMCNGRRILAADRVVEEVERGEDKDAPYRGNPENYLGEFHAHLGGDRLCAMDCTVFEAGAS